MAPGVGKTIVAIRAWKNLVDDFNLLIICRRDDFMTWRLELDAEHSPPPYEIDSGSAWLPGNEDDELTCCIVTYDLIRQKRIRDWIQHSPFHMCIADEAHSIKRWKAARTKAVVRATRHIPSRIAMTGSAVTNHVLDVFSLGLFIDNGRTFGASEWAFLKRYYIRSGPGWYQKKSAPKIIAEKLKQLAFAVHEDEVLKLPPILGPIVKSAPFSPEQKEAYEKVLTEWEYETIHGTVEIDQVIVQLAKLRQIAGGFLYAPIPDSKPQRSETVWFEKIPKLELLADMLRDPDSLGGKLKVVIWCSHTAEIDRIVEMLGPRAEGFCGSMDRARRERTRLRFRDDPQLHYFVAQVDMGVGMNELVVADTAVYYSNSLKVLSKQQSRRRIRRVGSERHKTITYYELVTEGSVDIRLLKSVSAAMSLAHEIVYGLKQGKSLRSLV